MLPCGGALLEKVRDHLTAQTILELRSVACVSNAAVEEHLEWHALEGVKHF